MGWRCVVERSYSGVGVGSGGGDEDLCNIVVGDVVVVDDV